MKMFPKALALLAASSLVLMGGCILDSKDEDLNTPPSSPNVPYNPNSDAPTQPTQPQKTTTTWINETVTVGPGKYLSWKLTLAANDQVSCTISPKDHDINAWFVKQREFEAFQDGGTFYYFTAASREKTGGFSFNMPIIQAGTYYLILDNVYSLFTTKHVTVVLRITR